MIHNLFHLVDPIVVIKVLGLAGIFIAVFAESGLFFGFFFPGDSLIFTAGFLASQNYLNIGILLSGTFLFSVLGDNTGYWFGKKIGPKIFAKEDSKLFKKSNLDKAKRFYEKYGNKTIVLARFIPVVRTFAPILAGVGAMKYKDFLTYNVIGGFFWSFGLILGGFFLGRSIPDVDKYLLPIIIGVIVLSVLPVAFEIFEIKKHSK